MMLQSNQSDLLSTSSDIYDMSGLYSDPSHILVFLRSMSLSLFPKCAIGVSLDEIH